MARDYGKVLPRFWNGETGRKLRGDGDAQRVALYLITGLQANMIGLYQLPLPLVAHEIGMTLEEVESALARLAGEGFAHYDHDSETIWVVEGARIQIGESLEKGDKLVRYVQRQADAMRNCPFYNDFIKRYASAYHLNNDAPSEGHAKPLQSPSEGPTQAPSKPRTRSGSDPSKIRERAREGARGGDADREAMEPEPPRFSRPSAPAGEDAGSIPPHPPPGAPHIPLEGVDGKGEESGATDPRLMDLLAGARTRPEQDHARRWRKSSGLTPIAELDTGPPTQAEEARIAELRDQGRRLTADVDARVAELQGQAVAITEQEQLEEEFPPPPPEAAVERST